MIYYSSDEKEMFDQIHFVVEIYHVRFKSRSDPIRSDPITCSKTNLKVVWHCRIFMRMLVSPNVVVSSHTVDEDDAQDYDFLQRHYLEPQLRPNQELPEGMTLRRVSAKIKEK